MTFSEPLAQRVRNGLTSSSRVEEKNMMGGLTFMVNGKMCVGVLKDELMIRLDPTIYESALKSKGCREMNFTGKPLKGFVFVGPEGTKNDEDLNNWLTLALDFNIKVKESKK